MKSNRFIVVWSADLPRTEEFEEFTCYDDSYVLIDRGRDLTQYIPLGCDGGEPEDQTFGRDLRWLVDLLNEVSDGA